MSCETRGLTVTAFPRHQYAASLESDTRLLRETVVRVTGEARSPRGQALALWRFANSALTHSMRTGPIHESATDILTSGGGSCSRAAKLVTNLCLAAGIPARIVTLADRNGGGGHVVCEAYYNGAWHMLDADQKRVLEWPFGNEASVRDILRRNPRFWVGVDIGSFAVFWDGRLIPYNAQTETFLYGPPAEDAATSGPGK